MITGIGDRIGRKIDAYYGGRYLREIRSSVAGAATQVEDAPPGGKTRCQCVAGHVLRPQIVIDKAGNDALSRECAHGVTTFPPTSLLTPLPTFVFTLMRQSR